MSIHTKTSLKSVKKEDLVQMYLELQGKYNDVQMDDSEIEKLKEHYDKTMSKEHGWGNALMAEMYEKKDLRNEELAEENEKLKEETVHKDFLSKMDIQMKNLTMENEKLKEEVKELTKYSEISTIIADMECQCIYEYAEITDAERLCELGWADKDDFACLR